MIQIQDYSLVTGSVTKPLTTEQVKCYLKTDSGGCSDSEIVLLIDTVTNKAEQITGRDLIIKTYKGYLDCFPCGQSIGIQKSKLQSI